MTTNKIDDIIEITLIVILGLFALITSGMYLTAVGIAIYIGLTTIL